MKFQPDHMEGVNAVSRLESGRIWVHQTPFESSLLVPWQGAVQPWPVDAVAAVTASHFEQVLSLKPELVIFGSGPTMRFIPPQLYRVLIDHHIGIETMDTAAACRTFNVLASEGRKVVAALLLAPTEGIAA